MTTTPVSEQEVESAHRQAMQATVWRFGPVWTANATMSLPHLAKHPPITKIRNAFAGKPAVIVAPGPSLERNLADLRAIRDRVVVLCYARSLIAIQSAGMDPDFLVVLDPLDLTHFVDGADVSRVNLITGITCAPQWYDYPWRSVWLYSGNQFIEDYLSRMIDPRESLYLTTTSSVATTTTSAAIWLGCDPIIYIGQDLSYPRVEGRQRMYHGATLDGRSYVDDEPMENGQLAIKGISDQSAAIDAKGQAKLASIGRTVPVSGYFGGTVQTSITWKIVREWIERQAKENHPTLRWVNATEGGARFDGFIHRRLRYCTHYLRGDPPQVNAVLDAALEKHDTGPQAERVRAFVTTARKSLWWAKRITERLFDAANRGDEDDALDFYHDRLCSALEPVICYASMPPQFAVNPIASAIEAAREYGPLREQSAKLCQLVDYTHTQCHFRLVEVERQMEEP